MFRIRDQVTPFTGRLAFIRVFATQGSPDLVIVVPSLRITLVSCWAVNFVGPARGATIMRIRRLFCQKFMIVAYLFWGACLAPSSFADGISFQLTESTLAGASGGTVTFTGTVTNNSGGDLNASDFFFNFFGFDPTAVTPNQDLGVSLDFLIPNGTTSALVALFDVTLGSGSEGASFPLDALLEDINGDVTDSQVVTLSTSGPPPPPPPPVSEPSTFLLLASALVTLVGLRQTLLRG